MVGIVTGQGAGLERGSAGVLGSRGQIGGAIAGRGGDQVYVNAATGGLVVSRTDEFLLGRGPDAFYSQTYNSSGADPATAWTQSVNRLISNLTGTANTAGSTVTRGDGDGHSTVYTYDSAKGAYVTKEGGGAHDELRYANGAWTWTDGDSRMRETYTMIAGISGYHFVSSRVDADGNAQTYSWTAGGELQRITNSNGEYSEFTLANGLPTQITTYSAGGAATLTRVRYVWDSLRRLSSVTVDLSPGDHSVADGKSYTSTYTYDGSSSRITTITQSDGSKLDISYTQSASEFRVTKLTQTVSGGVTRVTGLYYDLATRTTTLTDPLGGATTLRYDAAGNLIQVTHPVPAPGTTAPTTSFAYNSNGDVISVTEAGRTTAYEYDSNGNLVSSRDSAGNTVTRTYGSKNELLTSTQYLVPDPDGSGPAAAGTPITTRYAYDAENHLRFTVSGDGRVTEYRYDAVGTLASTLAYSADRYNTAGLAATSSIAESSLAAWAAGIADKTTIQRSDASYDFRGNVSATTSYSKTLSDGSGDLNSTFSRTLYAYDQAGNLLSRQIVGNSAPETFVYDGLNRIVSSTDSNGAVATFAFNDPATTTTVTLSGGTTRVSVFNKAGERISHTESGAEIATATTTSAYDALGRLRTQTDPTGRSTYFLYDGAGRKVADVGSDGSLIEYGYDSASRLVKSVAYMNRLSTSQVALLSGFSAGGAGGDSAGGVGGTTGNTLISNGSFEQSGTFTSTPTGRSNTDLPGWTKSNPETFEQVTSGQMGVFASDGSFWLDLESIAKTGVAAVGSNLLTNGGFEQSGSFTATATGRSNPTLPGWAKTNAEAFEQVSSGQMGVAASEGAFWLDMESVAKTGLLAVGSNLLTNGSFETSGAFTATSTGRSNADLPGWTKANGETFEQVLSGQMGVTASNGSYWFDMESISKTGVVAVGSNLVSNGSFETSGTFTATSTGRSNTDLPGWTKANGETFEQVTSGQMGVTASNGTYWLDLESVAKSGMMPVGSNLLVNGSFGQAGTYVDTATGRSHTSIPGWTKANPETFETVASGQMGVATLDGGYWLDLESTATTGPQAVGGNLVVNGSFEQSTTYTQTGSGRSSTVIPGWSKTNPENFEQVLAETTSINATDGVYWLELDSIASSGGSGPNLIVNGSFEESAASWAPTMNGRMNSATQNIPGWVKANAQGFEQMNSGAFGVAATDGSFYLDMESVSGAESRMDISQTVAGLTAGQQLTLKFDYANIAGQVLDHEGSPENSGALEVYWNGLKIGVVSSADPALTTKSFTVSSIAGNNVLRFKEIGIADGKGVYLDNVRLTANTAATNGGNMDIYQTIPNLAAGQVMQLQFDYSARGGSTSGSFEVWWNSTLVATITDGAGLMKAKSYFVTAAAGNNTLRFKGIGTVDALGGAIDNVRVYATQSPPHGGNMDISQTVANLTAGQIVQLQFDHANRTTAASGSFEVWWNGALVATIAETNPAMQTKTYQLTAVAGNNTLRFRSLGTVDAAGASLDNVRLFAMAPVPTGGNMDISQTIGGLAAGQTMQLQFDHANRTTAASGSFEVWWNSTLVATINETNPAMQTKTYLVTAIAGNNSLRFKSLGTVDAAGASIDNVRLFATQPVPSGGNMDISQTVAGLAAGQVMQLQFDHANRTTAASGSFEVYWNNALVATVTDTGTAMQTKTFYVTAIAGSNALRFRSIGTVDDAGASIDNVRLFATQPVPSGGNMDISQTVSGLAAGQVMQLQFDHANRTSAASGSFEVYWNNALVATISDTGTAMQTKTYLVNAIAGNNTLRFKSLGTVDDAGASIDNVRLFATQPVTGGGNMDVSQTVGGLAAGQAVQLQFDHANRTSAASGSFEVYWNGALVATIAETGTAMRTKAYNLTAIAGNNTLRFKSLGTVDEAGASIDNVRLFAMQSGGPGGAAPADPLAGLRPAASASDDWTWNIYDSADRLIETIDGAGRATLFSYDGASRLVSTTAYATPFDAAWISFFKSSTPVMPYLPAGNSTTDRATRNFYDSDGRVVGTLDGAGGLTQIFHDAAGQKIREIAYANPAAANLRATGTFAQLLGSVGSSGSDRRTDYVYDQRGLVRFTVDPAGHPTEFVHDSAGRIIRTVDYAGAIGGAPSYSLAYVQGQISANGLASNPATRITRSVYDGAGRLAFTIDAEGATSAFAYDQLGRVVKSTRYSAVFTAAGDQSLAGMQSWAASQSSVGNRVTRQIRDVAGRTVYAIDAEGFVTQHRYDAAGRVIQTLRHTSSYDPPAWATPAYMAALMGPTMPGTAIRNFAYDNAGRLTDVTDVSASGGFVTHYVYDALDQIVEETVAYGTAEAVTLRRTYDAAGRVVSETRAYGTADAATTSYGYDALGNLLSFTDARGFTTLRSYDALGRTVTTTAPIDASTNAVTTNAYNRFGEVVQTTDARGHSSYVYYDRLGRAIAARDAENYITETSYTVFGEVSSVTRRYSPATNAANAATYPISGPHPADATTSFLYDRLGRLVRRTDAQGHYEQFTLDAFGNRISVRNKLGGYTTNTYDRRGLLTSTILPMESVDSNGNVVSSTVTNRFEYDSRGNRSRMIEAFGLAEQRTTSYFYDELDRLIETRKDSVSVLSQGNHVTATNVTPVETIKYDLRGNIVETKDANGTRTLFYYDRLNRKIADISGAGTLSTYALDKNGNVTASRTYGTAVSLPGTAGGTPPAAPGGEFRETNFTYDRRNLLKTSSMAGVRVGAWNGSSYATSVVTLNSSFDHDAAGNVIKTTDAGGGTTFSYYDKLGRKTAEIDAENYLTAWTFDAEGNVLTERRYATQGPAPTVAAPPAIATHGDDRVTVFTYDRNGRRLTEQRLGVVAYAVGAAGNLVAASSTATIAYSYNGLGLVTRKTEASGDYVDYAYDSTGRLLTETRAPYSDQNGASVRPTVRYSYDGLNNLTLTRQGSEALSASDRFTRYTYSAGGRLATLTDAAGATRYYAYDASGNLVRETYYRQKSDGNSVHEAVLYGRDGLGRIVSQGLAAWNGSSWTRADTQNIAYNAHGEVAQRGLNGMWQEQFAYDNRGRMWRSNSGDGVWRYFVHDANDRQTLTLESEGLDLAGRTLDQVLSTATQNGTYSVGDVYVDGINATISVFDRRGLAIGTRQPKRQLSEAGAVQDLSASRGYNAFGDVAWERDARNNQINYAYNTMGRNVSIQRPAVAITLESGAVQGATPTDYFYYDVSGRLIGMDDANGNRITRKVLAGSGYGGTEALVTEEYHADGGVSRTFYDAFGDARLLRNELNQDETRTYDAMGRMTGQTHRGGLTDNYVYDLAGQRIQHWNNVLQNPIYGPPEQVWVVDGYYDPYYGWVDTSHYETHTPIVGYEPDKELTDYDVQGRVISHRAFGGDVTTTTYSWSNLLATGGMGTFGGWTQTTTYANGRSSTEQTDMFGRDVYKSDLGSHISTFGYDLAGRMIQRGGGETFNFNYLNTGVLGSVTTGYGSYGVDYELSRTVYGYDATGNKTSELYTKEGGRWEYTYDPYYGYQTGEEYITYAHTYQNATASFDALGRMTSWNEVGNATAPASNIQYEYDAVGNVRRTYAQYRTLDSNGGASAAATVQDQWYRYDAMNRLVTAKGVLSGNQIVRGTTGTDYTYDVAGQRKSATRTTWETAWINDPWSWDPYYGNTQMPVAYEHDRREDYTYDGAGNLDIVRIAESSYWDNGDGTLTVTPPPATGEVKADYTFDLMGRITRQVDYLYGSTVAYERNVTYNSKSQIASEVTVSRQGADTISTSSYNDYGVGSNYALGAIVGTSNSITKNNVYQNGTSTSTYYQWWDGAVQSSIVHQPNTSSSTTFTTTYNYSASGVLNSVYVGDGRPRWITFVNDMNGQAIRRDESDNNWSQGDPHEVWYRFNGKQLGYTGNNGTLNTDYQSSINNRTRTPGTGAFRFGSTFASQHADFDLSVDAINSYNQGGGGGSYAVRAGDTLASIAAQLWGDSSLWYKLAEANGMSAANALTEGQRLTVPPGVVKNRHNASTFRPFDPSETLGDTSPTTPQPQRAAARKSNKCGIFGAILLVIIAVAVTVVTAGAAAAALSPAISGLSAGISAVAAGGAAAGLSVGTMIGIGAASAALGSIASQGFGVATGIQEEFSWKGVAMAAIGGGIGAGFGAAGTFSGIGNGVVRGVVSGVVSNALTQGVGVVTGLQHKFDWAGVAAAGVSGGVSAAVGAKLGDMNKHAAQFISSGAAAIAGAATRSLIEGTDFGDNLLAALPDVIGTTIGNMLSDAVADALEPEIADSVSDPAAVEASEGLLAPPPAEGPARIQDALLRFRTDPVTGQMIMLDRDGNDIGLIKFQNVQNAQIDVRQDGDVVYYIFPPGVEIFPIVRTKAEGFTETAKAQMQKHGLDLVINGAAYEFPDAFSSYSTYLRAERNPLDPKETLTIGRMVAMERFVAGRSSPGTFYFAKMQGQNGGSPYIIFGAGDPPTQGTIAAAGGGIPLIINGLSYGGENLYSGPVRELIGAPKKGDPGGYSHYLTQRNSDGFAAFVGKYEKNGNVSTGKTIVGHHPDGRLVVIVQPDDAKDGRSVGTLRDILKRHGFNNAIMFDGSSSSMALTRQGLRATPATYKNNSIGTGIGFRLPRQPLKNPLGGSNRPR